MNVQNASCKIGRLRSTSDVDASPTAAKIANKPSAPRKRSAVMRLGQCWKTPMASVALRLARDEVALLVDSFDADADRVPHRRPRSTNGGDEIDFRRIHRGSREERARLLMTLVDQHVELASDERFLRSSQ